MTPPQRPNDLGGQSAGRVNLEEQATAYWEWQIDAMVRLALSKGLLSDFAELRDGIEQLTPDDYQGLSYYERWAKALAYALVDKGVIDAGVLDARVADIARRQEKLA